MPGNVIHPWKIMLPIYHKKRIQEMREEQGRFTGKVVIAELGGEFVTIECEDELDRVRLEFWFPGPARYLD